MTDVERELLMMRKKLLVLSSTYPRWSGDTEPSFVHDLSRRLAENMEVTVLCPSAKGASRVETMDNVNIVRYRYAPNAWETLVHNGGIVNNIRSKPWKAVLLPSFVLSQIFTALWLCLRSRPDVLHAHWLVPQGAVAALVSMCFRWKIPFVVTSHGTDLWSFKGRIWCGIKGWVAHRASTVTVVSRAMLKELANQVGAVKNVVVAPMGVDLENRFRPATNEEGGARRIITVGRLIESKGVEYLIGALPELLQRFPDSTVLIVGDGPDKTRLQDMAKKLGVLNCCEFAGKVSHNELPELYRSSSVFVAPFLQEGLGLVCIEALGCGCPVIASDIPALADIIEHSGNIHLVPTRNSGAIANAITTVFSDVDMGLTEVKRSHSKLCDNFGWNVVTEGYVAILNRAIVQKAKN
ncbi:glycosyltransferase [Marinobacter sp. F3R11]|uniref:glycosyltransferase n=1 Tax=Marinobacter sp. F3R11 TaxID=2267231 RepID=UPI000DE9720C|nr:glycosyltransferase [Marinobacter sp. F3R11]RBW48281.1 glycosyltransferase family 4 protein [Marinobacter sp. F3R11]